MEAKNDFDRATAPLEAPISSSPSASRPIVHSQEGHSSDRLSIPFALRLPLSMVVAGSLGFALGAYHGSQVQGFRFRAENAHRFPTTQTGWYFYHKSKNYHMALGGIYDGLKMGFKQSVWVGIFCGMEEFVDRGRAGLTRRWTGSTESDPTATMMVTTESHRDFLSSLLAGLGTSGAFSAWHRFPVPTTARLAKMGAKAGLAFGLLQDVLSIVRGRKVGYIEFVKRHTFWPLEDLSTGHG